MKKSLIVATSEKQRVIGIDNTLPWKLKDDMKLFVEHTKGKTVIMGRKTFESLGSKPLKGRHNRVITSDTTKHGHKTYFSSPETGTYLSYHPSVEAALAAAEENLEEHVVFIGGERIYREALLVVDEMIVTFVDADVEGDAFFTSFTIKDRDGIRTPAGFTFGKPFMVSEVLLIQEKNERNDHSFVSYKLTPA